MTDYTEYNTYIWIEIVYHGAAGNKEFTHVKRYEFGKWEKWGKRVIDPLLINQYERIYFSWLKKQKIDKTQKIESYKIV